MKYSSIPVLLFATALVSSCAHNQQASSGKPDGAMIAGDFPENSAFSKLSVGISMGHVHDILGKPTDSKSYITGKAWIPFYFGSDVSRFEETYKGIGIVTYTGAGLGGVNWKLYRAVYDPTEDGYSD